MAISPWVSHKAYGHKTRRMRLAWLKLVRLNSPFADESGFHLLSRPSPTLQKIVGAETDSSEDEALAKFCGCVISFVTERHDLDALKLSLFQAIRRISCRSYGMQVP